MLFRQQLDAARKLEAREVRHLPGNDAEGERDLAALAERIHPEARQARQLVGGVELACLVELGDAPRCAGADLARARPPSDSESKLAQPSSGWSSPSTRIRGGRSALKCTSLAPCSTATGKDRLDIHTTPIGRRGGLLRGRSPHERISSPDGRAILFPGLPGVSAAPAEPLNGALAAFGPAPKVRLRPLKQCRTQTHRQTQQVSDAAATVEALARALELHDYRRGHFGETAAHAARVTQFALMLTEQVAPQLALDPQLAYGFRLHDIGMIGVSNATLLKPGPLSPAELDEIREHPWLGERIVAPVPALGGLARQVIAGHHERWDGSGYPRGCAAPRFRSPRGSSRSSMHSTRSPTTSRIATPCRSKRPTRRFGRRPASTSIPRSPRLFCSSTCRRRPRSSSRSSARTGRRVKAGRPAADGAETAAGAAVRPANRRGHRC